MIKARLWLHGKNYTVHNDRVATSDVKASLHENGEKAEKLYNLLQIFNSHFNFYCNARNRANKRRFIFPAVSRQFHEPIAIIRSFRG